MDLLPIRLVKFDQALNTGQIGWKFTEITFVCLPVHSMAAWLKALDLNGFTHNSTGRMPSTGNVISMDLHLNSTGQMPLTPNSTSTSRI